MKIRILKKKFSKVEKILEMKIEENGSNLSLGQRQLITITRALLKKPKILLMDEATASIDYKRDEIIQRIIKENFKESTVISIAHRLNSINGYDKILVLEDGVIAEFGDVSHVFNRAGGVFRSMVENGEMS